MSRDPYHEYEIWVAMQGEAVIRGDGWERSFVAGDVAHFPPEISHQVVNDGTADFEMYAIWWDEDLSERFTARHRDSM